MNKKPKIELSPKFWLTALSILCAVLIFVSFFTDKINNPIQNTVSTIVVPLQKGINGLGLALTDKSDYFKSLEELRLENEELKAQLDELKDRNLVLVQDQLELSSLRELYKLDEKIPSYTKVAARVIGKTSGNWYSSFTIDKGSKAGIKTDMNVICGNGLVGIVTEVGTNYSIVRSIIDDSSNVTGMLITTTDTCNVKGDLSLMDSGMIHLEYLDKDVDISDGEMIVTSNISSKYLPGILIGYSYNITLDSNSLTQSGYLVPAVDFEHMNEVLVITQLKKDWEE